MRGCLSVGRANTLAHLYHVDRSGSGVSWSEIGTRSAPGVPPQREPHRGPSVHHRARVSTGAGDPAQTGGGRGTFILVPLTRDTLGAAAGDRDVPAARRTHLACTQTHQ